MSIRNEYTNQAQRNSDKTTLEFFGNYPYRKDQSGRLSLSVQQMKFLNPAACQYVNPYSKSFWRDMKDWLSGISSQAAAYPKDKAYRLRLAPHLLRKVTMTADSWMLMNAGDPNGMLHLMLRDIRLLCAYNEQDWTFPNIAIDHMHIWVSKAWMNLLPAYGIQAYGGQLTVTGILYEYVSDGTRNIGIMPVLLEPKNYRVKCIKRPDSLECPGA